MKWSRRFGLVSALSLAAFSMAWGANTIHVPTDQPTIQGAMVTLRGNTRPEAKAANDRGRVSDGLTINHMMLQLQRTPEQEHALEQFIQDIHDPASPLFHHWITAEEFGQTYGVGATDVAEVTGWLQSQGFVIHAVYPNQMLIDFSGSAGQIRRGFQTEIHNLNVNGEDHIANMSDPQIPASLAASVAGIVSLNDFRPRNMLQPRASYTPAAGTYSVVPADLWTIYNFGPAFTAGYSGQGQTIVVVENTDLYATSDWNTFRSVFGLSSSYTEGSLVEVHPAGTPTNNCTDPGVNVNESEAAVDVEWASAGAPSATIELAACADTPTNFGGFIALQNLLNAQGTPPAIVSISYGESESSLGAAFNAYINSLYQQAVAEGVSIFVSSGDYGAEISGYEYGINASGFTTTPYNVSVGGTDFADTYQNTKSTYWSSTNSANYGSALSYLPEIPWNESCASVLYADFVHQLPTYGANGACNRSQYSIVAGSGGPSGCATGAPDLNGVVSGTCAGYPKPSWQAGFIGNPNDGVRDIPDVSLFASSGFWAHAYVFCLSDTQYGGAGCSGAPGTWPTAGGTSFSAPIMAAIQALVNQASGTRWGNPNPAYYSLAATEYSSSGLTSCNSALGNTVSSNCTFYDVNQIPLLHGGSGTGGDIDVYCYGINCYRPSGTYGVLSTAGQTLNFAEVTNAGGGYATAPACTISGGGGAGAGCSATLTGVVAALTIANGGSGYTSVPSCTLAGGGGSGAACQAKVSQSVGQNTFYVSSLIITSAGTGYTSAPTCTISGGGGSGANCVATESLGVASVTITSGGGGYITAPHCVLTGGGGTGATCATLGLNTSSAYQPAYTAGPGWDFATGIGTVNASNLVANFSGSMLIFTPSGLVFPFLAVGTASAAQTVTVTNPGTNTFDISTVAIAGTTAADFSTSADTCTGATLAPKNTCTVGVTFTPSALGGRTASLNFTDNASGSPQAIPLSGTGAATTPLAMVSPGSVTFATQNIGTTSAAQAVVLSNGGVPTLTISNVGITSGFTLTNNCGSSLSGGASCTLYVAFVPTQQGDYTGTLIITDNTGGTTGSTQSVSLAGRGIALPPVVAGFAAKTRLTTPVNISLYATDPQGYALMFSIVSGPAHGTLSALTAINSTSASVTYTANSGFAGNDSFVYAATDPYGNSGTGTANINVTGNPVPAISQPLSPGAVAPGSAGFTLKVNGAQFVSGAVVNWQQGSTITPLTTTYVSATRLTANVPASLIATAGTATVTVVNPSSGGSSNVIYFPVVAAASSVSMQLASTPAVAGQNAWAIVAADFNGDGIPDLAVAQSGGNTVDILLGNGDGTFTALTPPVTTGVEPRAIAVGDFNGDGKLDLAVTNEDSSSVTILLGNGDGTFSAAPSSPQLTCGPIAIVAGDFDGDGKLDLAVLCGVDSPLYILLGNGDGTFTAGETLPSSVIGNSPEALATGDFNGDGKLDLAVAVFGTSGSVTILLGNGDGTFTAGPPASTLYYPQTLAVGDLNGDRKPDLVLGCENGVTVLLGNGDGTFTAAASPSGITSVYGVVLADLNGDGILDLALGTYSGVSFYLGKGDGTFTASSSLTLSNSNLLFSTTGDFNGDGKMDLALLNSSGLTILVQESGLTPSPTSLNFNYGYLNTPTAAQTVTFTNTVSSNVTISSAALGGPNAGDFAKSSDTCSGATLTPNGTCAISVTFSATATGTRSGSLTLRDSASNAPLEVLLSGYGEMTFASLSPGSLSFGTQSVGTTSSAQSVTVTNLEQGNLIISAVSFGGNNQGDFAKASDTCTGVTLTYNGTCTVSVTFTPQAGGTRSAWLSLTDNANNSTVTLTGTGAVTTATLSPTSLSFGPQLVGTTSAPLTETVTNTGTANLIINAITFGGTYSYEFAKTTDTCTGASVAPNATCTFGVTFYPYSMGSQSATLSLTDNAFNTPAAVTMTGAGIEPVASLSGNLNFGNLPPRTTSASSVVTVTNTGTANLSITSVTITGSNPGDFAKSADTCTSATVAPNGACTLKITFRPGGTGNRNAWLNFFDNAIGGEQQIFMSGSGTPTPVPFIQQPLVPDAVAWGSAPFTLTVNGSGFASGAVVNWQAGTVRSPLNTTFVSSAKVTAAVPAALVATPGTAAVSVVNPGAAAVPSNIVFLPIAAAMPPVFNSEALTSTGDTHRSIAVGDFNGDGKLDLLMPDRLGNSITVYVGKGDGTFQSSATYPTGTDPEGVAVGDFNGDGKLDFVVINSASNALSVFLGKGDGTFIPGSTLHCSAPYRVAVGDFNGDGKLDIIVLDAGDNLILLFPGNGDGTFGSSLSLPTGWGPEAVMLGDFNGDGNLDLAVVNFCGSVGSSCQTGTVSIYLGDGTGNFSLKSSPAIGGGAYPGVVGDFNGDGILDLAVSNVDKQAISILLGNGDGTFDAPVNIPIGDAPFGLATGDFNGDGKLDLAAIDEYNQKISILLGDGAGGFTNGGQVAMPGLSALSIATADFNGDGLLDLAVAGQGGFGVTLQAWVPSASPTLLQFGTVVDGSNSTLPVVLRNPLTTPFSISNVSATANFSQINNCGSSLASLASCTVSVEFNPTAVQSYQGTLAITGSYGQGNFTVNVSLAGTGAAGGGGAGASSVNPTWSETGKSVDMADAVAAFVASGIPTLVGHVEAGNATLATTAAINTTGATLLVAWVAEYQADPTGFYDSNGNTWQALPVYSDGVTHGRFYFAYNPTVGPGHTFSLPGRYPAIAMSAWSGTLTTSGVYQGSTGANSSSTTALATGSLSLSGLVLVITGWTSNGVYPPGIAVDSGFTILGSVSGTVSVDLQDAYLVTRSSRSLASLAVTPANGSLTAGATQQFIATGTYNDSSTQNLTSSVTWSSTNTAAATIASGGLATGVAVGSTTIQATLGSISGSTGLTVTAAAGGGPSSIGPTWSETASNEDMAVAVAAFAASGIPTLVGHAEASYFTSATTSAIDTTGATLLVAWLAVEGADPTPPTDNYHNTWQPLPVYANGTRSHGRFFYAYNPTVGPGHTFTAGGLYIALAVSAWSGMLNTSAVYQGSTGAVNASTQSLATGSLSFTGPALLVTAWASDNQYYDNLAVNQGFTMLGSLTEFQVAEIASHAYLLSGVPRTLVSLAVTPGNATIPSGGTQQFTATGTYSDRTIQDLTSSVTWSSTHPAVATVASAGLVTGVAAGSTTIQATLGSISGLTSLTVTPAGGLSVGPTWSETASNEDMAVAVAAFVASGTPTLVGHAEASYFTSATTSAIDTTGTTLLVAWLAVEGADPTPPTDNYHNTWQPLPVYANGARSHGRFFYAYNPTVGPGHTFSAGGLYIALEVSAWSGMLNTSAVYQGSTGAAYASTESLATGPFSFLGPALLVTAWASDNQYYQNLAVNQGFTILGSLTNFAVAEIASHAYLVTGSPGTLASLSVTPANASLTVDLTKPFTATGTYSDGTTQNLTNSVTWSSTNTAVATIASGGLATGVAPGSTTIQATLGSISASTGLTVYAATHGGPSSIAPTWSETASHEDMAVAVAAFAASGTPTLLGHAETNNFTSAATSAIDTTGATLLVAWLAVEGADPTPPMDNYHNTWQPLSVYANGTRSHGRFFYAYSPTVGPGHTFSAGGLYIALAVTAWSGTLSTSDVYQNSTGASNAITMSLATGSLAFTAPALLVTAWASDNQYYQNLAVNQGFTVIGTLMNFAEGEIVSHAYLVSGAPGTLVSMAVTPANGSLRAGATQQFTATGTYSDSSTQNLTSSVTWSSTNTAAAMIASGGLVTGAAVGSTTIQATLGSIGGSTGLTVTAAGGASSINPTWSEPGSNVDMADAVAAFVASGTPILVAHAERGYVSVADTPELDTTGATLLVAWVAEYQADPTGFSDNYGNAWQALPVYSDGVTHGRFYYAYDPKVGPNHSFSLPGRYPAVAVSAWSGMLATSAVYQGSTGATHASTTSLATGLLSLSGPVLVITGWTSNGAYPPGITVDSGFTVLGSVNGNDSVDLQHAYFVSR